MFQALAEKDISIQPSLNFWTLVFVEALKAQAQQVGKLGLEKSWAYWQLFKKEAAGPVPKIEHNHS